ncbi:MAG: hypothetical protein ABID04_01155, partial [Patescibacteria group bacterium]
SVIDREYSLQAKEEAIKRQFIGLSPEHYELLIDECKKDKAEFESWGLSNEAVEQIRDYRQWIRNSGDYDEGTGLKLDEAVAMGYLTQDDADEIRNAHRDNKQISEDCVSIGPLISSEVDKRGSRSLSYWAIR